MLESFITKKFFPFPLLYNNLHGDQLESGPRTPNANLKCHQPEMSEGLRKASASKGDALFCEKTAFSQHINNLLEEYEDLFETDGYLPLNGANLIERMRDGVILAYLIHHLWSGQINLQNIVRGVRIPQSANDPASPNTTATLQKAVFLITANLNCVLTGAKGCGLVVVNIGAGDIMSMNEDLILGLLWQIIRAGLLRGVDLVVHPELVRLLGPEESLKDFMAGMRPETLLLRWFNYHLKKAGSGRQVGSWGRDLNDSLSLFVLLDQLYQHRHSHSINQEIGKALAEFPSEAYEDRLGRAEVVLRLAQAFGLEDCFVKAEDIAQGHPRLTMALTAALFNCHIGISLPSEDDITTLRQERDELLNQTAHMKMLIESTSKVTSEQYEQLLGENKQLQQVLEEERTAHAEEVSRLTAEFQAYREELSAQYKDSLECSISFERKNYQQDRRTMIDRQNGLFRLILIQASLLHRHASKDSTLANSGPLKAVIDAFKTLNIKANTTDFGVFDTIDMETAGVPPEDWLSINFELIESIAKRNRELNELSTTLHRTVAHKEHVNEVMGTKIREFTEEYIKNKSQDNSSNHSKISRIFSFKK